MHKHSKDGAASRQSPANHSCYAYTPFGATPPKDKSSVAHPSLFKNTPPSPEPPGNKIQRFTNPSTESRKPTNFPAVHMSSEQDLIVKTFLRKKHRITEQKQHIQTSAGRRNKKMTKNRNFSPKYLHSIFF